MSTTDEKILEFYFFTVYPEYAYHYQCSTPNGGSLISLNQSPTLPPKKANILGLLLLSLYLSIQIRASKRGGWQDETKDVTFITNMD